MPIERVNEELMREIELILADNKANSDQQNCQLNFAVFDSEKQIMLDLSSKNLKINPNNKFLEQLLGLNVVNYKLN